MYHIYKHIEAIHKDVSELSCVKSIRDFIVGFLIYLYGKLYNLSSNILSETIFLLSKE